MHDVPVVSTVGRLRSTLGPVKYNLFSKMSLTRATVGVLYHYTAKHHLVDGVPWLTKYPVLFECRCLSASIIVICLGDGVVH